MKRKKEQVKAFAKELVANGFNRKQAMKKVCPGLDNDSIHVKTTRWLQSEEVMKEVAKQIDKFDSKIITPEYVYYHINKLLQDKKVKPSVQAVLLGILSKCLSMTSDNLNIKNEIDPNLSNDHLTNIISKERSLLNNDYTGE